MKINKKLKIHKGAPSKLLLIKRQVNRIMNSDTPSAKFFKWTSNFAYGLGLLVSDGSLSKDGRHIEFTSKDFELVNLFKKCWNLENKITFKFNSCGNKTYRIQFSNVKLYKNLLLIGLTPNKSKTLSQLKVPSNYLLDFV